MLRGTFRAALAALPSREAMLSALSLPPPGEEAAEAEVRHAPATPAFPAVAATITAAALTANALTAATSSEPAHERVPLSTPLQGEPQARREAVRAELEGWVAVLRRVADAVESLLAELGLRDDRRL